MRCVSTVNLPIADSSHSRHRHFLSLSLSSLFSINVRKPTTYTEDGRFDSSLSFYSRTPTHHLSTLESAALRSSCMLTVLISFTIQLLSLHFLLLPLMVALHSPLRLRPHRLQGLLIRIEVGKGVASLHSDRY
jgi:hypothetical protein